MTNSPDVIDLSSDDEGDSKSGPIYHKEFEPIKNLVQRIAFNRLINIRADTPFPYDILQELVVAVKRFASSSHSFPAQQHVWQHLLPLLQSTKLAYKHTNDLNFDKMFNFRLVEIMTHYVNFQCQYIRMRTKRITLDFECERGQILTTLHIMFGGQINMMLNVLLKINVHCKRAHILSLIFKHLLSKKYQHNQNDVLSYFRLVLCYKKWKLMIPEQVKKERINKIALGILPAVIPTGNSTNFQYNCLGEIVQQAMTKSDATRFILDEKCPNFDELIQKFFAAYQKSIFPDEFRCSVETLLSNDLDMTNRLKLDTIQQKKSSTTTTNQSGASSSSGLKSEVIKTSSKASGLIIDLLSDSDDENQDKHAKNNDKPNNSLDIKSVNNSGSNIGTEPYVIFSTNASYKQSSTPKSQIISIDDDSDDNESSDKAAATLQATATVPSESSDSECPTTQIRRTLAARIVRSSREIKKVAKSNFDFCEVTSTTFPDSPATDVTPIYSDAKASCSTAVEVDSTVATNAASPLQEAREVGSGILNPNLRDDYFTDEKSLNTLSEKMGQTALEMKNEDTKSTRFSNDFDEISSSISSSADQLHDKKPKVQSFGNGQSVVSSYFESFNETSEASRERCDKVVFTSSLLPTSSKISELQNDKRISEKSSSNSSRMDGCEIKSVDKLSDLTYSAIKVRNQEELIQYLSKIAENANIKTSGCHLSTESISQTLQEKSTSQTVPENITNTSSNSSMRQAANLATDVPSNLTYQHFEPPDKLPRSKYNLDKTSSINLPRTKHIRLHDDSSDTNKSIPINSESKESGRNLIKSPTSHAQFKFRNESTQLGSVRVVKTEALVESYKQDVQTKSMSPNKEQMIPKISKCSQKMALEATTSERIESSVETAFLHPTPVNASVIVAEELQSKIIPVETAVKEAPPDIIKLPVDSNAIEFNPITNPETFVPDEQLITPLMEEISKWCEINVYDTTSNVDPISFVSMGDSSTSSVVESISKPGIKRKSLPDSNDMKRMRLDITDIWNNARSLLLNYSSVLRVDESLNIPIIDIFDVLPQSASVDTFFAFNKLQYLMIICPVLSSVEPHFRTLATKPIDDNCLVVIETNLRRISSEKFNPLMEQIEHFLTDWKAIKLQIFGEHFVANNFKQIDNVMRTGICPQITQDCFASEVHQSSSEWKPLKLVPLNALQNTVLEINVHDLLYSNATSPKTADSNDESDDDDHEMSIKEIAAQTVKGLMILNEDMRANNSSSNDASSDSYAAVSVSSPHPSPGSVKSYSDLFMLPPLNLDLDIPKTKSDIFMYSFTDCDAFDNDLDLFDSVDLPLELPLDELQDTFVSGPISPPTSAFTLDEDFMEIRTVRPTDITNNKPSIFSVTDTTGDLPEFKRPTLPPPKSLHSRTNGQPPEKSNLLPQTITSTAVCQSAVTAFDNSDNSSFNISFENTVPMNHLQENQTNLNEFSTFFNTMPDPTISNFNLLQQLQQPNMFGNCHDASNLTASLTECHSNVTASNDGSYQFVKSIPVVEQTPVAENPSIKKTISFEPKKSVPVLHVSPTTLYDRVKARSNRDRKSSATRQNLSPQLSLSRTKTSPMPLSKHIKSQSKSPPSVADTNAASSSTMSPNYCPPQNLPVVAKVNCLPSIQHSNEPLGSVKNGDTYKNSRKSHQNGRTTSKRPKTVNTTVDFDDIFDRLKNTPATNDIFQNVTCNPNQQQQFGAVQQNNVLPVTLTQLPQYQPHYHH